MKIEIDMCYDGTLETVGKLCIEGDWDNPKFRQALIRFLDHLDAVSYSSVETKKEESK